MNEDIYKKITEDVEIHQSLPFEPNLSPEELQKTWDTPAKIIKKAFNEAMSDLIKYAKPVNIETGEETPTNTYVDGKLVYVKRIDFGQLPNVGAKSVPLGFNVNTVKIQPKTSGMAYIPLTNIWFMLPHVSHTALTENVKMYFDNTTLTITTGMDRSQFTESYVDVYYTKNKEVL